MSQTKQMDSSVHLKNGFIAEEQEPIGPRLHLLQCQDMSETKKAKICFNAEELKLMDNAFRKYSGYPPKYIITQLTQQMGIPRESIRSHIKHLRSKLKRQRRNDFKIGADPQLNYKFNESLATQNPNDLGHSAYGIKATQNPNGLVHSSHDVQDTQNPNNGFAHSSHGDIFEHASHASYNFGDTQPTQNPNDLVPLSNEIHASQNPNDIKYLSYGMQATQNPNGLVHPSHEIQVSQSLIDLVHLSHGIQDTQNPNNGFVYSSHGNIFERSSHRSYNFGEATNICVEYKNLDGPTYPSMNVEIAVGVQNPDIYTMREDEDNDLKKCTADVWDQSSQLPDTSTQPISQNQQYEMSAELHEWLAFLNFPHRTWCE